jgi:hypothetical protein
MQPVMEELTLLNATGESTWLSTHNSILFGAIDNMSPTQVAQYAASLFAGGSALQAARCGSVLRLHSLPAKPATDDCACSSY